MIIKQPAPAKINLTLHVTGQRADGYHMLDSLVVFADMADQLTATLAPDLRLDVSGPFAQGVPTDDTNLILRAATVLRDLRGVKQGAALTLEKNLPHAAGIGSGSSDAAATLTMLSQLWNVPPLPPTTPEIIALGADIPICLKAPKPTRMSGIGDVLSDLPPLPSCALVLIRPPIAIPTPAVFKGLHEKNAQPMPPLPNGLDFDGFAHWLSYQRNDLSAPASMIAPEIGQVIAELDTLQDVAVARMSGSGATCFALVRNMIVAQNVAQIIRETNPTCWVAPAAVLT